MKDQQYDDCASAENVRLDDAPRFSEASFQQKDQRRANTMKRNGRMTIDDILPLLKGVRRTSRGYMACCPAHDDRHPSLSITEGDRVILLKCFAGCELAAITDAIGITIRDLFYDTSTSRSLKGTLKQGDSKAGVIEAVKEARGLITDTLREADYLIQSRRNREISTWSADFLDAELDILKLAHELLWAEEVSQWI